MQEERESQRPRTLDYARHRKAQLRINWGYVLVASTAATVFAWVGFLWASSNATSFGTVFNGLVISVVSCLIGGLLLVLALVSLAVRMEKPNGFQALVLVVLTVLQWIAFYKTDLIFIVF